LKQLLQFQQTTMQIGALIAEAMEKVKKEGV
jgi:hypothetical protein